MNQMQKMLRKKYFILYQPIRGMDGFLFVTGLNEAETEITYSGEPELILFFSSKNDAVEFLVPIIKEEDVDRYEFIELQEALQTVN
jgi:hypothetical protein